MSESIGVSGSLYNTQIPEITENANIQTALRYYHYGSDTNNVNNNTLNPNSMAGFLNALENSKLSKTPETIPTSANLNEAPYTSTGFYHQADNSGANSGTGYPRINNVSYAGLLKVVNSGNVIYQEYHMANVPGFNTVVFYRLKFGSNDWPSAWTRLSDSTHIHDERYYTQTQSNSRHIVLGEETFRSNVSLSPVLGDSLVFDGTKWVNGNLGYRLVNKLYYSFPGTFTFQKGLYPWLRAVNVRMVGGGGAGASLTNDRGGAGGAAGAYLEAFVTNIPDLDSSVSISVGAGGRSWEIVGTSQVVLDPVVDGGASSFGPIFANGGRSAALNAAEGSIGEDPTFFSPIAGFNNVFSIPGGDGGSGHTNAPRRGGHGGASYFGGGGRGKAEGSEGNGRSGRAYGSGGGGANRDTGTRFGGNGAPGLVIVELYA